MVGNLSGFGDQLDILSFTQLAKCKKSQSKSKDSKVLNKFYKPTNQKYHATIYSLNCNYQDIIFLRFKLLLNHLKEYEQISC